MTTVKREEGVTFKWFAAIVVAVLIGIIGYVMASEVERNRAVDDQQTERLTVIERHLDVVDERYKNIVESLRRLERAAGTLPDTARRR